MKAKLIRPILVKRKEVYLDSSNLDDGELLSQSQSQNVSAGRGFHKNEGKQNKVIKGRGLNSSSCADPHSTF